MPKQVANFPISDGEVDQPIYEGPQTRSCTNNLMKANILMDQTFDIEESSITNRPAQSESFRDLILDQQVFAVYINKFSQYTSSVVTWWKLGHIPLIVDQDFC